MAAQSKPVVAANRLIGILGQTQMVSGAPGNDSGAPGNKTDPLGELVTVTWN